MMKVRDNPFEYLFSSKEISQHPMKLVHGVQIDFRRIKDKRYVVKKLYQIISYPDRPTDSDFFQWRIAAVRALESLLRTQYRNTRDLKRKIEGYLKNYEIRKGSVGERIRKSRQKLGLTQKQAAELLGFKSHVTFVNYEKGLRYPPEKVFRWLEEHKCNRK